MNSWLSKILLNKKVKNLFFYFDSVNKILLDLASRISCLNVESFLKIEDLAPLWCQ